MDTLKTLFFFSFLPKKDAVALAINILIYLVIGALVGLVIGLVDWLPLVGWVVSLVGAVIGLYILTGIVLSVLDYLDIIH